MVATYATKMPDINLHTCFICQAHECLQKPKHNTPFKCFRPFRGPSSISLSVFVVCVVAVLCVGFVGGHQNVSLITFWCTMCEHSVLNLMELWICGVCSGTTNQPPHCIRSFVVCLPSHISCGIMCWWCLLSHSKAHTFCTTVWKTIIKLVGEPCHQQATPSQRVYSWCKRVYFISLHTCPPLVAVRISISTDNTTNNTWT